MSTIAENIRTIRETMAEAARQAGRDPSEIRLCAATKMNDAAAVRVFCVYEALKRGTAGGN